MKGCFNKFIVVFFCEWGCKNIESLEAKGLRDKTLTYVWQFAIVFLTISHFHDQQHYYELSVDKIVIYFVVDASIHVHYLKNRSDYENL